MDSDPPRLVWYCHRVLSVCLLGESPQLQIFHFAYNHRISEKFLTWTDQDPSLDQILDSVTLYWLTDCFPTSIYPYSQFYGENAESIPVKHYVEKPLGYSWFPMEIAPMPKAWVAKRGNLVWHREHKDGGHFAAMEKPDELVQDIEDFVAQVWKGES